MLAPLCYHLSNLSKLWLFALALPVSAVFLFPACGRFYTPLKGNSNKPINSIPVPTPIPNAVADKELRELFSRQFFTPCQDENGESFAYAVDGLILHQLKRPVIVSIDYDSNRPTPIDLEKNIRWVGTMTITATSYQKFDISNYRLISVGSGTGLEDKAEQKEQESLTINFQHIDGAWWCDLCDQYKAPVPDNIDESCKQVNRFLTIIHQRP